MAVRPQWKWMFSTELCNQQSHIFLAVKQPCGVARFICADHGASTPRLTLQVKSCLLEIHAGHAARWGQANDGQASYSQNVENYALLALSSSPAVGSLAFDADAELLLGGADIPVDDVSPGDGEQSVTADRGAEVAYFLATLRLPQDGAPQAALQNSPVVSVASHPSRSIFAAAHEDGCVHLWRFGQRQPFQQLPRASAPALPSARK
eukprot:s1476_g9.t1